MKKNIFAIFILLLISQSALALRVNCDGLLNQIIGNHKIVMDNMNNYMTQDLKKIGQYQKFMNDLSNWAEDYYFVPKQRFKNNAFKLQNYLEESEELFAKSKVAQEFVRSQLKDLHTFIRNKNCI